MRVSIGMSNIYTGPGQERAAADEARGEHGLNVDRREFLSLAVGGALALSAAHLPSAQATERKSFTPSTSTAALTRVFENPPANAGPGAYWYWLGGNVTKEGITADLEAMHAAGITQPMLFSIGGVGKDSEVPQPAGALTDIWWSLVEHSVAESARLGLTLALNFCDGWATASGPWITPELSMQQLTWSALSLQGGRSFTGALPIPPAKHDYYRDIVTLAFPLAPGWEETSFTRKAAISTNLPLQIEDADRLSDPEQQAEVMDTEQAGWIQYAFDKPFTLRSVTVKTPAPYGFSPGVYRAANSLEVQASDDGETFRKIGALEYPKHGWQTDLNTLTHAVPETTARYFRLVHTSLTPGDYQEEFDFAQDARLRFFNIVLSGEPRIHHVQSKSGAQWGSSRRLNDADIPDASCVQLKDIVDLTSRVRPDGTLQWKVPRGRWRVLRIGYTTTGSHNSAAGGAQGLECDRFSPEAARLQFDRWFGQALQRIGPDLAGKVLHVLHVDSWEAGSQNWSPAFREGFRKLRGYDLLPYLALMTGVPVVSAEASERVLLDVRRTINDLTQSGFFATVARLAHEQGCIFSGEPASPTYPVDGLEHAAHLDVPMGEFWLESPRNDKPTDVKDAVSGGRIYGKKIIGAEAYTQRFMRWDEHPFSLKALGDHMFCEGINRFLLHVYAQQPFVDRARDPGMTLNGIGAFFSRTQTWWKPGKAWFDYLRRSQAILQTGVSVSDVCYFIGEDIPSRALLPRQLAVALPAGYAYDSINRDALLNLSSVQDGALVLESGVRYRVLVLPEDTMMSVELARRLSELVHAGLTMVGRPPSRSLGFADYLSADQSVREIARELWGDMDGTARTERTVGKGRVIWGKPLADVLQTQGVGPDVSLTDSADIEWIHRRGEGWDAYFISNQSKQPKTLAATFRVRDALPELWRPDTGKVEAPTQWQRDAGGIQVSLSLDPVGSLFVVFGRSTEPAQRGSTPARREVEVIELDDAWDVSFADRNAQFDRLVSWTERTEPDLRYFSGTAVYRQAFTLNAKWLGRDQDVLLDLGQVHELAEVWLNGHELGVLWKLPFTMPVTSALRRGQNTLELRVTNTWRNRLIGDDGKTGSQRHSYVVPMLRKGQPWLPSASEPLLPSGLLGPVRLRVSKQ